MIYKLVKKHATVHVTAKKGWDVFEIPTKTVAKWFKPAEDIIFVKASVTEFSFTVYKKLNPLRKNCQF